MSATDFGPSILETLRSRILRGLNEGTLELGTRLPSARELVAEFESDHRPVLAAYRQLAAEGLVEIRERGGVYVAARSSIGQGGPAPLASWIVDTYAAGYARELAGPSLAEWMRRSIETLRLRAVVIAPTQDHAHRLANELASDFGLVAKGIAPERGGGVSGHQALTRADLIVAVAQTAELARAESEMQQTPYLIVELRPDFVPGEWAMMLRQPVWVIVATPEFGAMMSRLFAGVRGQENLHIAVHGRDDLSAIPEGAPVFVTHRVRDAHPGLEVGGRLLPAPRSISVASAREVFDFIVRANLRAAQAVRTLE